MIYLASPYAHDDPDIMQYRYERALYKTMTLMKKEICVYSPIVHNHHIAFDHGLPRTWDFWKKMDLPILARSSGLIVLTLDGWLESIGVRAEINFAESFGLAVSYHEDN